MDTLITGITLWIMGYAKGMQHSKIISEAEMKESLRIAISAAKDEFCKNVFGFHTEYEIAVKELTEKHSL